MKIKIRKSIPDDVYGIREVQRETWLTTYPNKKAGITVKDIKAVFENDNTPHGRAGFEEKKKRYLDKNIRSWVAEENGKIIAFCGARKENNEHRVGAIYVLPDYQRKGIGGLLITKAFTWLGNKKDVFVNVASYNRKAINFYKKYGFLETGRKGVLDRAAKLPTGNTLPETEMMKSL